MSDSSANSAQDLYDAYMLCRIAKLKMPEPDIAKERDRFVNDLISKIQSGNDNDDEATILIEYLNYCLAQYCPHLPEPLLRYFGDAFGQIGMGVDSGRALNLKPKQKDGAKNSRDSSRRKRFYFRRDLHWYLSLKSLMTHEGLSFENALGRLENNVAESCISGHWYKPAKREEKGNAEVRFKEMEKYMSESNRNYTFPI